MLAAHFWKWLLVCDSVAKLFFTHAPFAILTWAFGEYLSW
jgi:hypothetical protein